MGFHRSPAPVSPLLAPGWTERPATCGTQAVAQSSQDKATTTSLSAAKPLSAKLRLQSRLTLQIRTGQGLFPIPKFQNKAHSPEGCVVSALLKRCSILGMGGHLPLRQGCSQSHKSGFEIIFEIHHRLGPAVVLCLVILTVTGLCVHVCAAAVQGATWALEANLAAGSLAAMKHFRAAAAGVRIWVIVQ